MSDLKEETFPKWKTWTLGILALVALFLVASGILVSCGPRQTSPQAQIDAAVAATLASIPTRTPDPIPTPYPSPTPFTLEGVFCEYKFCIGHPLDVYLIDEGATRNPPLPSTYGYGILFSYNQSIFMQIAWTISGPSFDPQTTMHLIMEEAEQFQGNMDTQLIGDLNVFYNQINTIAQTLPYGGVAAWQCSGRDFAWKVYTPQDGVAQGLLRDALKKFRCDNQ
jgi:hypothetical protein